MAFGTFTDLQAEIAGWLNRADLAANIPSFIRLAEAHFDTVLRIRDQVESVVVSAVDGTAPLPADLAELITLFDIARGEKLDYLPPAEALAAEQMGSPQKATRFYSLVGSSIRLVPRLQGTADLSLAYYARVPKLGAGQPTNWLLERAPHLYLYGALVHSAPFLKDDARVAVWADFYQRGLDDLRLDNERAEFNGSPLKIRSRGLGA